MYFLTKMFLTKHIQVLFVSHKLISRRKLNMEIEVKVTKDKERKVIM